MFCTECGQENKDDAKFCRKCGNKLEPLDNNVSEQKEVNENPKPIKDTISEQKEVNNFEIDEILKNIEFKAIVIGSVVTIIILMILSNIYSSYSAHSSFFSAVEPTTLETIVGENYLLVRSIGVMIGSVIAGYLTKNSTKYSLIYGAIIGCISTYFFGAHTPIIPITMGLIGGYMGKYMHDNYG